MNRSRVIRLFIFVVTILFALWYPLYVRNYLLELTPYLPASGPVTEVFQRNLAVNKLLIFNSLLVVLFPMSVLFIYLLGRYSVGERLFFRRNQVDPTSKKNFQLHQWYDKTRRYLGNDWFIHMFDAIRAEGLLPKVEGLTIVSPAANRGVYEKHLYDHLKGAGLHPKFVIADIDEIENHAVKDQSDKALRYVPGEEALRIGSYLSKVEESRADLIFDIKGSIWYSFRSDGDRQALFAEFHKTLNEGGVVVIDNSKKRFLAFCIYYLFGQVTWYVETSTGFLLNKNMKRDRAFKDYMEKRFERKELRFLNEFGDPFDIMVLKKKSS